MPISFSTLTYSRSFCLKTYWRYVVCAPSRLPSALRELRSVPHSTQPRPLGRARSPLLRRGARRSPSVPWPAPAILRWRFWLCSFLAAASWLRHALRKPRGSDRVSASAFPTRDRRSFLRCACAVQAPSWSVQTPASSPGRSRSLID